jgi:hypothetical protein
LKRKAVCSTEHRASTTIEEDESQASFFSILNFSEIVILKLWPNAFQSVHQQLSLGTDFINLESVMHEWACSIEATLWCVGTETKFLHSHQLFLQSIRLFLNQYSYYAAGLKIEFFFSSFFLLIH